MDADFRATINSLNDGKHLTVHKDLTPLRFVDSRIGKAPKYGLWKDFFNIICMKILYEKQSRVLWNIMLDRERDAERRRARYMKVKANRNLREPVERGDQEIGKEGQPIIQQACYPSPPSPPHKRRHGDTGGNGEMTLLEKAIQKFEEVEKADSFSMPPPKKQKVDDAAMEKEWATWDLGSFDLDIWDAGQTRPDSMGGEGYTDAPEPTSDILGEVDRDTGTPVIGY